MLGIVCQLNKNIVSVVLVGGVRTTVRTTQYQVGGVRTTEPWQRWSGGGQQPGSRGQESEQHQHTSRAQVWTRGACHVIHFAMLSFPVMLSGLFVHAIRMYDVKWWPIHIT